MTAKVKVKAWISEYKVQLNNTESNRSVVTESSKLTADFSIQLLKLKIDVQLFMASGWALHRAVAFIEKANCLKAK